MWLIFKFAKNGMKIFKLVDQLGELQDLAALSFKDRSGNWGLFAHIFI